MQKKQVLIVTNPLNVGGYDIVASNLQKNLDPEKFECTYCLHGEEIGVLEESVKQTGAKIIHQPGNTLNYFKSYFYYKDLFKQNHYDIVHSHLMFFSGIVMRAAYKSGVKTRVPHSHMTNPCIEDRSLITRIIAFLYSIVMKRWLVKYATHLIACGPEAGEYLYGKKAFAKKGILLNNGTYTDDYQFNELLRNKVRQEFGIENKIVVGHVGRFNYVKNHKFLLDVFAKFQQEHPDSVLMLVGDGEQRQAIQSKAKELGIDKKLILTGTRNDVNELLMAMDVFVFPSLYEGFPMTLVEAQATKLPCLISNTVTSSSKLISAVEFLSLNDSVDLWSEKIYQLSQTDRQSISTATIKEEFDIKSVAKKLEDIYLN